MKGHEWVRQFGQSREAISGRRRVALGLCSCGEPEKSFQVCAAQMDYADNCGPRVFSPAAFGVHLRRPDQPVFALVTTVEAV